MSDAHPGIRVQLDGPVLTLTLASPDSRNAQTPSLWLALAEVGESLPPEVRVVVIRAEGASFSAGLHRQMLAPGGMPGEADILELAVSHGLDGTIAGFQRGFTVWRSVPAIVVAAVQGHAVGAGFQLALGADLRLLADDAQLCMREAQLGLIPDLGGTGPLVDLVGYARALEICATGRFVGRAGGVRPRSGQRRGPARRSRRRDGRPGGGPARDARKVAEGPEAVAGQRDPCRCRGPARRGAGGSGRVAACAGRARPGLSAVATFREPQVVLFSPDVTRAVAFYASLGFEEVFRTPTTGEPIHVDLALDAYRIGIASVASTRDDHGLDPVASGSGPRSSSGPTTWARPTPSWSLRVSPA